MGKKGGGSDTVTSSNQPPQVVIDQYTHLMNAANSVAGNPLNQYGGSMIAGFTPDQQAAFQTIRDAQGLSAPYINQAADWLNNSTTSLWNNLPQYNADSINQYYNPYQQNVINSTMANINETNAQQQNQLVGDAISKGAWGGDRAGVAAAELARQQNLSNNQTLAGLQQQGYGNAQQMFQQQQQQQLNANTTNAWLQSQGAFGMANLGNQAFNTALQGAAAQAASGQQQQTMAQSALNIPYEMFLQQQAYPYQQLSWLSGISTGLGSGMGGTSSTTQPAPNGFSQGLGTVMGGIGMLGSLGVFSDRRMKEDIDKVGEVNGYPLYTFKYKESHGGDGKTPYVGVMAQDVEKRNPRAVGRDARGFRYVDYEKLARGGPVGFAPGGGIPEIDLSYIPTIQMTRGSGAPQAPAPMKRSEPDLGSSLGLIAQAVKGNTQGMTGLSNVEGRPVGVPADAISWGEPGAPLPWLQPELPWLARAYGGAAYADGGMTENERNATIRDLFDDPYSRELAEAGSMGGGDLPAQPVNLIPMQPQGLGEPVTVPPAPPVAGAGMPQPPATMQPQQQPGGLSAPMAYQDIPIERGTGLDAKPIHELNPWNALAQAGFAMAAGRSPHALTNIGEGAMAGLKNWSDQKERETREVKQVGDAQRAAEELFNDAINKRADMFERERHNRATEDYSQGMLDYQREALRRDEVAIVPDGLGGFIQYNKRHPEQITRIEGPLSQQINTLPVDANGAPVTGDAVLGSLDASTAAQIQRIATGQEPWPQSSNRNPMINQRNKTIAYLAEQYDPSVNGALRAKTLETFSTKNTPEARTTRSFNVIADHLHTLDELAGALDNGDVKVANAVYNKIANQFGATNVSDFETAKKIVSDELVKAVVGGTGGGVRDREQMEKAFDAAKTIPQLKSAIGVARDLVRGQFAGMEQSFNAGYFKPGTARPGFYAKTFVSPNARKVLGIKEGEDAAKAIGEEKPAPGAPEAAKTPLSAPPAKESRVEGQVYNTPKGPMTWTKAGWIPAGGQ